MRYSQVTGIFFYERRHRLPLNFWYTYLSGFCNFHFYWNFESFYVFGPDFRKVYRIGQSYKLKYKSYFDFHRIETGKVFLGDKVKKVLVNRIGFWGLFFILELSKWYWDSGSGIPILDIGTGEFFNQAKKDLSYKVRRSTRILPAVLG